MHAAPDPGSQPVYAKLPLSFEENRGQASADVRYLSRSRSGVLQLRPGSFSLDVDKGPTISVRFVGAAPSLPIGEEKLIGTTSYFLGDEADWVRAVPNYASVRYRSVYPGIDAVFHGNREHLEYDFVLRPGADPARIRIAFEGADRIVVDAEGNLQLSTPHGTMTQLKPRIWQDGPHGREEVAGRYVLSGAREARFEVDRYDRRAALVIDPIIEYSTYFGSPRDDRGQAVATDSTGATYVAGSTATGGVSWGFVSKVNPGGTAVMYTAFFGSNVCDAAARGIAVDSLKDVIVTGFYVQQDAAGACSVKRVYGAKINPAGDAFQYQLVWGSGVDYGTAVAVDRADNAYFTGSTHGDFPTTPGVIFPSGGLTEDAFITKLSPTGALIYSTYLDGSLNDEGLAIAVDTKGNAYVAGSTSSADWPTTAYAVQATMPNLNASGFITKVNTTATKILYSTFLGGSSQENVAGIAVDAQQKIHVTGNTASTDFPATVNAWDSTCGVDGTCDPYTDGTWHNAEDAFYSKIDPLKAGAAGLIYSTFLGGSSRDFGEAIGIDKNGRAWITGRAGSNDFPSVSATQGTFGGNYDAFVAQIDPALTGAASLQFSSFLGGALYDDATGIAVDSAGDIHVVGYTASTNFPVDRALQPQSAGGNESFIVKIVSPALVSTTLQPATVTAGANSTGKVKLSAAAPAGGAVVALTSSKTDVATVPPSVTVVAGKTTATFPVATEGVTAATTVTITATYNGLAKTAKLTVNPPAGLAGVSVNPATVTGAAGSTGTVTLGTPAPAGGAVVMLASSDINAATTPASVTVTEGTTTATFTIATKTVTAVTAVTITATYGGVNKTATLTVNPPAAGLASVTVNPATVTGAAGSTGTVTLSAAAPAGGAIVTLASSDLSAATVPASVTVPAGATTATFTITTKAVTVVTAVTITAGYTGVTKTATLTVNPPAAVLTGVSVNPGTVTGGAVSTGTVTLSAAAPAGGAVVTLASSNVNAATVPPSVTVPAGTTTATFAITTKVVTAGTVATISATYDGVSKSVGLAVNTLLGSLTLNPVVLIGGTGSTGTVTLTAPAPAGGTVVTLTSAIPATVTVPPSVTVAAGATSATFQVATSTVPTATSVNITATCAGAFRIVTITLNPAAGAALAGVSVNPATVTGTAGSTGTVTLTAAAPAGGAVVTLASSDLNAATVPATTTVPAGATTVNFAIATKAVAAVTAATVTATYNGVAKTATLTVNPPAAGLAGVSVNPAAVTGTAGSTGTVTLDAAAPAGGAVVTLASSDLNAATVPATTTVPAGATTVNFAIATKAVAAVTAVTITATYNGVARTATLTVNPQGPAALAALTMNPPVMIFGSVSTGTVTLTAPAPAGGAVVALTSSEWVSFVLPESVTVPAGATSAQFGVTNAIGQATTLITASYNGVNRTAALTSVYPTVAALTCTPNPVNAEHTTVCTVTMNGIMVADTTVWILSDQPFIAPRPAGGTVTVPAGAISTAFTITPTLVPEPIVANISANALATDTVTTPVTIDFPTRGKKWVLNNVVFKDGSTANGYFIYDAAAGKYLAVNIQVTPGPDPLNPLGHAPENLYYYPWPNGYLPTVMDDWSTGSLMSLQNPVTAHIDVPASWTLLQFNFAQALTNAGGTVPLVVDPAVFYTPWCAQNPDPSCTPPPVNISQELFALPENQFGVAPVWYFRVFVSGTVKAQ